MMNDMMGGMHWAMALVWVLVLLLIVLGSEIYLLQMKNPLGAPR